jgi:hypothetical protein
MQMQRTITEQIHAPAVQAEPDVIRWLRANPEIRSVVIIRQPKTASVEKNRDLAELGHFGTPAEEKPFLVTDLLENITYKVGLEGSLSELVFTVRDEQVIVTVNSGSDFTEIAHDFATHLAAIIANN